MTSPQHTTPAVDRPSGSCGWCGTNLTGKRSHARYCGAPCRAEASRWKHGRSGDGEKAHESADTPPIALIREEHEAAKAHWSLVVDEAIFRHFKADPGAPLHADDLESLGIPPEHRNVIGSQFAKWVNRRRMVECGRRASGVPSRNKAKSNEYRLTQKGRDMLVGSSSTALQGAGNAAAGGSGERHADTEGGLNETGNAPTPQAARSLGVGSPEQVDELAGLTTAAEGILAPRDGRSGESGEDPGVGPTLSEKLGTPPPMGADADAGSPDHCTTAGPSTGGNGDQGRPITSLSAGEGADLLSLEVEKPKPRNAIFDDDWGEAA